MKKHITKENCCGCEDDFYNDHNPYEVKECWCFEDAYMMKRKKVAMSDTPPWNWKPQKFPNCYRKRGYIFIDCEKEDRKY